jgi:hypothetical protein
MCVGESLMASATVCHYSSVSSPLAAIWES